MSVSDEDKMLAKGAYMRVQNFSRGFGYSLRAIQAGLIAGSIYNFWKLLQHPGVISQHDLIFAALCGSLFSTCVLSLFFQFRLNRIDVEWVRFFERQFPEECPWKEEEKILAAAEEIRIKADADLTLQKSKQG